jgi:hypothetical protein
MKKPKKKKPTARKATTKTARQPNTSAPKAAAKGAATRAPQPGSRPRASTGPGPAGDDRQRVEAAKYTPPPIQGIGWPAFRYPPQ